jgi:SAM-dependent methyltransferase
MAGFTQERLAVLAQIEREHFWFEGRRRLVLEALRRQVPMGARILDLGCGTGSWLSTLTAEGYEAWGLDALEAAATRCRRIPGAGGVILARGEALPVRPEAFDAVTLLDVLEHGDDERILEETHRVLRKGGSVLATVPAFAWLWSRRDDAAGHRRRYDRRLLGRLLAPPRWANVEMRFYQGLLFPAVAASRLLGRVAGRMRDLEDRPWRWLNRLLATITRVEHALGRFVRMPFGSTVLVMARRGE